MCRPVSAPKELVRPEDFSPSDKVRAARRIVRKYRKREEREEMKKLRRMIPRPGKLRKKEVINETISLILALEQQLMLKIGRQGKVPAPLSNTGLSHANLDIHALRAAMAQLIPAPGSRSTFPHIHQQSPPV